MYTYYKYNIPNTLQLKTLTTATHFKKEMVTKNVIKQITYLFSWAEKVIIFIYRVGGIRHNRLAGI